MCAIAGIFGLRPSAQRRSLVERMSRSLSHRGPDGHGLHESPDGAVILAHRRLAILDLSENGKQPMSSHDSRYVITYNGEIYNHPELRQELEKGAGPIAWRSNCDTETLLEAISTWGIVETLRKANGMFAFALFDRLKRSLYLARDRCGEKPLYFTTHELGFAFASELHALRLMPGCGGEIDVDALAFYLRNSYIPAPLSICASVSKLPAGKVLHVTHDINGTLQTELQDASEFVGAADTDAGSTSVLEQLEVRLSSSVRSRMLSDVPVGALLSGGVDSTIIVALMQRYSAAPVNTFTVCFPEAAYSEGKHAAGVARYLRTEHRELHVAPNDLLGVVDDLARVWGEPFADPAQVPTLLISRHARANVSVALTGDGGDELFFGYPHYRLGSSLYKKLAPMPHFARDMAAALLTRVAASSAYQSVCDDNIVRKTMKLARACRFETEHELCHALEEVYAGPAVTSSAFESLSAPVMPKLSDGTIERKLMDFTFQRYLPENSMTKTDRASMSVGLELRAPFLDPLLVNFARGLDPKIHTTSSTGKLLLRQLVYRLVPKNLVDRPKAGFSVPIAEWLRGPLRGWALDLLHRSRATWSDVIDFNVVERLWQQHQTGVLNHHRVLWNLLVLFQWKR